MPLTFDEIESVLKATEGPPQGYDSDGEEQKALRTVMTRASANRKASGVDTEPQLFFRESKMGSEQACASAALQNELRGWRN
jgi:hypothetical protein